MLDIKMYITLGTFILLIGSLLSGRIRAVYAFSFASFLFIITQVISVNQFIGSFANSSILSIFLLIFIASVLRENFNMVRWLDRMYSNTTNPRWFLFKNSLSVSALSSFMNNTPIVALMIPYTYQWAEKNKVSASKLLMPLSFAAITGGMITVIGTSTNLVLNGFLEANELPLLTILDFILPGIIVSIGAAVYSATVGFKLLPNNTVLKKDDSVLGKTYLMECVVRKEAFIEDSTVLEAGFRNLEGVFLAEIIRGERRISPVTPDTVIQGGDRLLFAGEHASVSKLVEKEEFLTWSKLDKYALMDHQSLLETVIPYNSNLIDCTLKEADFRRRFQSAVVGIHRNGEQVEGKLGNIKLKPGDLLIVVSGKGYKKLFSSQKDLYIVNQINESQTQVQSWRKKTFLLLSLVGAGLIWGMGLPFFVSLLFILGCAFLTGLTNTQRIKDEFNVELLMILGSAIAIGTAMLESGVGHEINVWIQYVVPQLESYWIVGIVLVFTIVLTSFVTNVAAVSIMFPVVYSLLPNINLPSSMVFLAVAFGASAAFITPVSYQTNLMVQGPGGYTSKDYLYYGFPMLMIYLGLFLTYLFMAY